MLILHLCASLLVFSFVELPLGGRKRISYIFFFIGFTWPHIRVLSLTHFLWLDPPLFFWKIQKKASNLAKEISDANEQIRRNQHGAFEPIGNTVGDNLADDHQHHHVEHKLMLSQAKSHLFVHRPASHNGEGNHENGHLN